MLDLSLIKPLVVKKKLTVVDKVMQNKLFKLEHNNTASVDKKQSDFGDWDFVREDDSDEDVRDEDSNFV